jgi:hypothetical protein
MTNFATGDNLLMNPTDFGATRVDLVQECLDGFMVGFLRFPDGKGSVRISIVMEGISFELS